jgi:DNA-directed RNA polymerase specialized sigma24 family protein
MSELSPPPPPLSDAEIRKDIASLTAGERTKLIKNASYYLWIEEPDELFQEALFRVLAGKRKWPRDLEKLRFLAGVIKSIAGDRAREQAKREQAKKRREAGRPGLRDYEGKGARGMQAGLDLERIMTLFNDDPIAQKMLMLMADGTRGEDIARAVGLSPTEYESKRKKIRRRIEKLKT